MKRILLLTGILGVLVYTLHVVLGAILWEGYNSIAQTISELTGSGAPNAGLLRALTTIYGILVVVFSMTAFSRLRSLRADRLAVFGLFLLIVMEITSFVGYGLFPLDTGRSMRAFQNIMHFIVTGIVVICTIGSSFFTGIGLLKTSGYNKVGGVVLFCAFIITIFGMFTPIAIANALPIAGLTERINIFALQVWIGVLSVALYLQWNEKEPDSRHT